MKNSIIITGLILAIALQCIDTIAQKQTPPVGGTPKDFKLPPKKSKTLDNGLKTIMVQYGSIPKVTVQLIIKTGNVHEAANEVWLADLTGKLMREGTSSMDSKTISSKVAGMGGQLDISVGMDQVTVSGTVLSEFASDLVKVIADIVMNPSFPTGEVQRLKADLKRQLVVDRAVPQAQAAEKFFSTVYKDHPYGRYFPTEAMLDAYNETSAKGFYEKNFGAKRSALYLAGKFDDQAVTKTIDETIGKWKAGPEINYPPVTATKSNNIAIIDRKDAPQSTVIIGLPTLIPKDKDFVALQVTNALLGGSFGSRITANIREDKGYTYSPHSVIQTRKGTGVWYEEADVTSEHTGASLQEIAKEIKKLENENPPKAELEGIQRYMAGTFVLQNSNPAGIINQLNFIDQNDLDESYLTDRVKNIYAITPQKVSQMVKDNFKYEDMTLVLVGDKKLLDKQIKAHEDAKKLK
ncbi:MAG: pitrilysin family protein [Chryseolinea sp.]